MQLQTSPEQQALDDRATAILEAGVGISCVQAKEIHKRHKEYAKRASNLKGSRDKNLKPVMQFEKLLLEQRLTEINDYLQRVADQ